jgi:hypothetical protein
MFRRRIEGVVVIVEYDIGERALKKLFSHKEENFIS